MGVSTDAILFYGIGLPDDYRNPWDGDFEDWICEENNIVYPKSGDKKETDSYYEVKRNFLKKEAAAEEILHCSFEYMMYGLAITGTKTVASRGSVESVNLDSPREEQIHKFINFLDKYKIPYERKDIGWKLVSLWG